MTFFVITVPRAHADVALGKGLDLDTTLRFRTDQDRIRSEYYDLDAILALEYEPSDPWEFKVEARLETDDVLLSELWGKRKFNAWRIKGGMFGNRLLVADRLPSEHPFLTIGNPVSERLDDMGWYSSRGTGISLYRNPKDGDRSVGLASHVFFHPASMEFQYDLGAYWAFSGEDSYLGASAAYYPFVIHDLWTDSSYVNTHNFLFTVYLADYREEASPAFKVDAVIASNLIDPVGYIHFPSDGSASWMFGTTAYVGNEFRWSSFSWTPGAEASLLIHSLEKPESRELDVTLSNHFEWSELIHLRTGLGLGFHTYYDSALVTEIELIWDINVLITI